MEATTPSNLESATTPQSELLNLPAELFSLVVEHFVLDYGLDRAMNLRYVCRAFDAEVVHSICTLRCLEEPWDNRNRYRHPSLLNRYLCSKAKPGLASRYYITKSINNSVDFILEQFPELDSKREEYTKNLCRCVVQTSRTDDVTSILHRYLETSGHYPTHQTSSRNAALADLEGSINGKGYSFIEHSEGAKLIENAFAAACCIGYAPFIQRYANEIRADTITDFGWPVTAAIVGGHGEILELLMEESCGINETEYPTTLPRNHGPMLRVIALSSKESEARQEYLRRAMLRAVAIGDLEATCDLLNLSRMVHRDIHAGLPFADWAQSKEDAYSGGGLFNAVLFVACYHGQEELASYAIKNDADVNCTPGRSVWGVRGVLPSTRTISSPIETAAGRGNNTVVRLLHKHGATATPTALGEAAKRGWIVVASTLLRAGAKLPYSTAENDALLRNVVERGHMNMVKLLWHK
ncbi:hypothetical protein BDV96DRAFT_596825 [Lophiotrema nucula]|uniref:Uncharacterized protein n=1 Tax=Lophiotrema nucula TaxID=690887 RepID=A0A6A5ZIR5_9PLEO|nr:hypothetical protein BDV96DRAFT_596825 [Lophiotrema nucula]